MTKRALYPAIAFAVGFLLTGTPYWMVPSHSVELPGSLLVVGLAGLSVMAFMLVATNAASARLTGVAMASAPAAAVFARVVSEAAVDPTSHNLWPFEIVYTLFAAGTFVLPAVIAAAIIRRRFA